MAEKVGPCRAGGAGLPHWLSHWRAGPVWPR
jgi:hypothetical protein